MKFSALMPVHDGVGIFLLEQAVNSVLKSKLIPNELIIIVDGSISKDKKLFLLKKNRENSFIKLIFKKKIGISKVLNYGLKISKYNIIARVDADDVNHSNRFLKQINFFKKNKPDILGTSIIEIIDGAKFIKRLPEKPNVINFIISNPINHMSVMFDKSKIIKLGGYPEVKYKEDYALWLLAKFSKYNFFNLSESLVQSFVDSEQIKRRKNLEAILSEFKIQKIILENKPYMIIFSIFFLFLRVIFLLMPNFLYILFIKNFYRKNLLK
jgi:amylovoran biosynthesis glycosyltransferase AmsE